MRLKIADLTWEWVYQGSTQQARRRAQAAASGGGSAGPLTKMRCASASSCSAITASKGSIQWMKDHPAATQVRSPSPGGEGYHEKTRFRKASVDGVEKLP